MNFGNFNSKTSKLILGLVVFPLMFAVVAFVLAKIGQIIPELSIKEFSSTIVRPAKQDKNKTAEENKAKSAEEIEQIFSDKPAEEAVPVAPAPQVSPSPAVQPTKTITKSKTKNSQTDIFSQKASIAGNGSATVDSGSTAEQKPLTSEDFKKAQEAFSSSL